MIKRYELKFNLNTALDNVLIIDGKYLVYRNQYSHNVSKLSYAGVKTGLYYGFFNTVRSVVNKFMPVNIVFAWDGIGSVRRDEYSNYKNRNNFKYMTEEQIQIRNEIDTEYPLLVALCESLGFAGYTLDGYEADDLIALFTKRFSDIKKIIITRDEDMYQLIDDNTSMYSPDDKKIKDLKWFRRTYDIEPEQWALVKAYGGCKSDTVPGIPGVAEKTAIRIIKGDEKAVKKLNSADPKQINLWKHLTILPHPNLNGVKIPYKITHLDIECFLSMCQQFNFRSFMEKISDFEKLC